VRCALVLGLLQRLRSRAREPTLRIRFLE
jgi:hypothetical protein